MAEETGVIEVRDSFYRDSYGRIVFVLFSISASILVFIAVSVYIYMNKPLPLIFPVDNDMRVLQPVPLNQPYLADPDLLQWVANVLPRLFDLDFIHYNDQVEANTQYFTADGRQSYLNQLNNYANYNNVQAYKVFVTGTPDAAPIVLRKGVIPDSGKYGWWVQMPVVINFSGFKPPPSVTLTLQLLVVRVSTLNNLNGVAIDNLIQAPVTTENQATGNA